MPVDRASPISKELRMQIARTFAATAALLLGVVATAQGAHAQTQTLVWQDNFDRRVVDANKWTYEIGNGCQKGICGWGNGELQYYTSRPQNARIRNGKLIIEARREDFQGSAFTSARLKTEGRMHFRYGTLEARIRFPHIGNGLWPAYWMLGTIGAWPANGEIDMMEAGNAAAIADGVAERRIGAAVHWDYQGSQADYGRTYTHPTNLSEGFHVYRMTWDPQFIRVSIDGVQYFEFAISNIEGASLHEFHQPQYLLLNLAVGGRFTGVTAPADVTAPLPARMEVDYIRLYQNSDNASTLYIGARNAPPPGRYGVYTERSGLAGQLHYGQDAELYLWNNLVPTTTPPYEGRAVMAFHAAAGNWYGMGVYAGYRDMRHYAGGQLRFRMKTSSPHPFRIGLNSSFGDSWLAFAEGGTQYGLVRDGAWHQVAIPFSAFHDLDMRALKQMFMLVADPPASDVDFAIDDVYYQSPLPPALPSVTP